MAGIAGKFYAHSLLIDGLHHADGGDGTVDAGQTRYQLGTPKRGQSHNIRYGYTHCSYFLLSEHHTFRIQ
ncbi:hypothetical protein SDC9_201059 [bioreactor metagenome]|uniref:Uncharacterized protein n=1 Tax=bioreactor metagenome TaxID=1076179 RepID=A0A645IPW2_9ZZZZ